MATTKTTKTQAEIEAMYDTDGDGIGPLERIMMKYDTNGDGTFTMQEVSMHLLDSAWFTH